MVSALSPKAHEFHPHIQDVFDYADAVVSGRKLACELERLACQRFYADLERDSDYVFSQDQAVRFIEFTQLLKHVKGKWASKRQPLVLEPWQKFIHANLYGWVHKETGLRRFRLAYIKAPRKSGKTFGVAVPISLYMFTADNEHGAEVYCGANSESQAWEVFRPAKQLCEGTPNLRKTFLIQVNARSMEARLGARFQPVIGKPGDGASPSCAIHDEYHEATDPSQFDTMATGMGAREQPLQVVITTAGTNIESPCFQLEREIERVLRGEVENDEVFGMIYGIDKDDDWTTEEALIKANPNYGVSVSAEFLKAAQKYAIQNSSKQNAFKTKHLNVWCWARSAFFNAQKWQELGDTSLKMEDFKGDECFVGLDLAKIHDISSIVTVFRRFQDGQLHYYVFSKNYLPEDTIASDERPELKERYSRWYIDGHLLAGGESEMDLSLISGEVIAMQQDGYNIQEIPHDPHLGFLIAKELAESGLVPVEMKQHGSYLGPGMREIEAAIAAGRIHHDGNPVTNWCIGNVQGKEFSNGGLMPAKENASSKIDAATGLIMAVARAMLGEDCGQAGIIDLWA
jgi:phage terminase large subunit-like protein